MPSSAGYMQPPEEGTVVVSSEVTIAMQPMDVDTFPHPEDSFGMASPMKMPTAVESGKHSKCADVDSFPQKSSSFMGENPRLQELGESTRRIRGSKTLRHRGMAAAIAVLLLAAFATIFAVTFNRGGEGADGGGSPCVDCVGDSLSNGESTLFQAQVVTKVYIASEEVGEHFAPVPHGEVFVQSLAFLLGRPASQVSLDRVGGSARATVVLPESMVSAFGGATGASRRIEQASSAVQTLSDGSVYVKHVETGGENQKQRHRQLSETSSHHFKRSALNIRARANRIRSLAESTGANESRASSAVHELAHCTELFSELSSHLGNWFATSSTALCPIVRSTIYASKCCSDEHLSECHVVADQMVLGMGLVTPTFASHGKCHRGVDLS